MERNDQKPWVKTKSLPPTRVTEDLYDRFAKRCAGFRPLATRVRELIEADVLEFEHDCLTVETEQRVGA